MLVVQLVNGLTEGVMLFLIASGLTLVFGVSRIINFAHGSLYMLGAFLAYTIVPWFSDGSLAGFVFAAIASALIVGVIGAVFEVVILRRIYHADELMQLIVTVALVFIARDAARSIWGADGVTVPMPEALSGALVIGDTYFPVFPFAICGVGLTVAILMQLVIRFTRAGVLLRAATDDRGMVALLGVSANLIFTAVFGVGAALAALAGALQSPFRSVYYLMDESVILGAFIVCVIGGLGNLYGALGSALLFGILNAAGVIFFPRLAMILIFLVMAAVLIVRSFRGTQGSAR